jgi:hypothetical protein
MASAPLVVQPLLGLPEIRRGDDLAILILAALRLPPGMGFCLAPVMR